ncbi:MAG TPA: 50S ribosomal protein L25, partial [Brevundimonas sp.]|nr:50S ribosomal protein L25 [Brevundimonas sp.]
LPEGASATITDRDFMIAAIKNSAAAQSDAGDTTAQAEAEA